MTLNQFLSYGLEPGKKYIVRLKTGRNSKKDFTLYFKGFRNFCCRKVVSYPSDIIPVFCETTALGKMSKKHFVSWSTNLDNIVAIFTPKDGTIYKPITKDEVSTLILAGQNYRCRAAAEIRDIIREMGFLFPGKLIPISPEMYLTVEWGNDEEITSPVTAVGYDSDEDACYCIVNNRKGDPVRCYLRDAHIEEPFEFLRGLIRSIEHPDTESSQEDAFLTCRDIENGGYEKLPSTSWTSTPTLFFLQTIELLKANLWFESLDSKERQEILKVFAGQDFPVSMEKKAWYEMDDNMKLIAFYRR